MHPDEIKEQYDNLFGIMVEEFEYLAAHRRAGLHMITGDDIARWQEIVRQVNNLKKQALS
jgi:hypothetical protein